MRRRCWQALDFPFPETSELDKIRLPVRSASPFTVWMGHLRACPPAGRTSPTVKPTVADGATPTSKTDPWKKLRTAPAKAAIFWGGYGLPKPHCQNLCAKTGRFRLRPPPTGLVEKSSATPPGASRSGFTPPQILSEDLTQTFAESLAPHQSFVMILPHLSPMVAVSAMGCANLPRGFNDFQF